MLGRGHNPVEHLSSKRTYVQLSLKRGVLFAGDRSKSSHFLLNLKAFIKYIIFRQFFVPKLFDITMPIKIASVFFQRSGHSISCGIECYKLRPSLSNKHAGFYLYLRPVFFRFFERQLVTHFSSKLTLG